MLDHSTHHVWFGGKIKDLSKTFVQPYSIAADLGLTLIALCLCIFSVGLPPLSKEELKNRRKMADRNKRNEQAKTAKIDPVFDAPAMRSSVSFGTPVRVSTRISLDCNIDIYVV